jgi:hypothetical protein
MPDVLEQELERLSPIDVPAGDWADVRRRGRRRPTRALSIAAVVTVAVALPALAFSSGVRSLLGFPQPIVAKSKELVSAPIGNGLYAHVLTGPSTSGGRCYFLVATPTPSLKGATGGGGACSQSGSPAPVPSKALPLAPGLTMERRLGSRSPAKWVPPIVSGVVWPRLHATRIAVVWHGGSLPLALRGKYFVGGSPQLYMPSFGKFPFVVTAYDANDRVVATKRLDSPELLMLSHGWKEYARLYHAWQKTHRR